MVTRRGARSDTCCAHSTRLIPKRPRRSFARHLLAAPARYELSASPPSLAFASAPRHLPCPASATHSAHPFALPIFDHYPTTDPLYARSSGRYDLTSLTHQDWVELVCAGSRRTPGALHEGVPPFPVRLGLVAARPAGG